MIWETALQQGRHVSPKKSKGDHRFVLISTSCCVTWIPSLSSFIYEKFLAKSISVSCLFNRRVEKDCGLIPCYICCSQWFISKAKKCSWQSKLCFELATELKTAANLLRVFHLEKTTARGETNKNGRGISINLIDVLKKQAVLFGNENYGVILLFHSFFQL